MGDTASPPPILAFLRLVASELAKGGVRSPNLTEGEGSQRAPSDSAEQQRGRREICGRAIAFVLESLVRAKTAQQQREKATTPAMAATLVVPPLLTIFDDPDGIPPQITLHDYVDRMLLYTHAPREVFVIALVLLDKLLSRCPAVPLRATSVHRLLFSAFVVASKVHDDAWCSNRFYARVAGVDTAELNAEERAFVVCCNFSLQVAPALFDVYSALIDEVSCLFHDESGCTAALAMISAPPNLGNIEDLRRYRKWLEFIVCGQQQQQQQHTSIFV